MKITTIEELMNADMHQKAEVKQQITVVNDLYTYMKWLRDGHQIPVTFTLGSSEKRSLGVHPSSISKSGVCPLKIYYECVGSETLDAETVTADFDMESQDTYDIGTAKHRMLQTMFLDMYGDQFAEEVKLSIPEYHIEGHADGVFSFPNYRFVLEIKTIKESKSQFGFEAVQHSPMPDHLRQTMLYMKALNVPFGLIFYWCKNNSMKKEHVVEYDQSIVDKLLKTVKPIVDAAYNNGPMVIGQPGLGCSKCAYLPICKTGKGEANASRAAMRYGTKR